MPPAHPPEPLEKLPTKKQVVAGFVVYRQTSDGIKFLLLYRRGNYWNFPKGHFEPGETTMDTALRELEEETGIKKAELRIAPNFRAYERFYFKVGNQGIHDTVILFLAETRKANINIEPEEHSGFGWFLYNDALSVLGKKYADTRKVLRQASEFLQPRRKTHPSRTEPHRSQPSSPRPQPQRSSPQPPRLQSAPRPQPQQRTYRPQPNAR